MVLVRKSLGEGAGEGGVDKGVPPLMHSTPLPLLSTFIEDRTSARVAVAGACPAPAGAGWLGGQAEVVVLGGTGATRVGAAAVQGPLSQVLVATQGWAPRVLVGPSALHPLRQHQ